MQDSDIYNTIKAYKESVDIKLQNLGDAENLTKYAKGQHAALSTVKKDLEKILLDFAESSKTEISLQEKMLQVLEKIEAKL